MVIEFQPYVGPRPFERKEQALFFGRDREADDLLSLVVAYEAVLLYAQSGAGKTSLINAGLLPLLEEERFEIFPLARVSGPIPETIEPEEIPNLYVFNTLMSWAEDEDDPKQLAQMSLASFLKEREHPTDEMELPAPRAVIFDQFEELFTLYPERWKDREGFFEQIHDTLEDDPLLRVVFVIREDCIAQLDPYTPLLPEKLRTRFRLERLRESAALLAVKGPLTNTGRTFAPGVAESLVKELLKARAVSATGEMAEVEGQYVEPVQLQVVCLTLWSSLPPETTVISQAHLQKFGDVNRALSNFYEDAIQAATQDTDVEEAGLRDWCGKTLITPMETRGIVYRGGHSTGGIPNAAVDILESRHLIRAEYRAGARWYELTHDRFIEPIMTSNEAWYAKREEARKNLLTEPAREWQRLGKDEGGLLRGVRLAKATQWAEAYPTELDELERAFLEASLTFQAREREKGRVSRILRGLAAGLTVALLIAAAAAFTAFRGWKATRQAQATALAAAAEAVAQRDIATSRQLAAQALTHLDDQFDLALLLGLEANRITDTVEARSSLLAGLEFSPHLTTFLHGHTDWVRNVAFSPDGRTLASGSADNIIILWDVATGQPIGQPFTSHADAVWSVAFSPDGQTLASGSADNTIILWDVATGQPIAQPLTGHDFDVNSVTFSPDGQTLASGSRDLAVILWDVATGQPIGQPLIGHTAEVWSVAFSPNGQTLASGSADGTIVLWDVTTGQPIGQPLTGHEDFDVFSVVFSPDGQTLASGSRDLTITLWDVATGQPIGHPLTGHSDSVFSVAFSPDSQTLASGSRDNTIILWDVAAGQPIGQPFTGHSGWVNSVAFSPDGQTLASGSADDTIILWDVVAHQRLGQPLTSHTDWVYSVAFSPDGQTLTSGSRDKTIILWDVATDQPIGQPLTGHFDWVNSVAFSPDSQMLASGSRDKTIILWDVATGQLIGQPLTRHTDWVRSVAFSPDGQTLASGSEDNTIILWDVEAHQPLGQPLTGHTATVRGVAFSPDGQTLASGSEDNTIILWDVATGQPVSQPLTGHTDAVLSVAFSPDGQTLASASYRTIILWDAAIGQPLGLPLTGHTDWVYSVAFSPDGQTLASGSEDNTIILWDVEAHQPLDPPLTGHTDAVLSVAFSPDGQTLASGSADATIILWDASFESWQARACRIANRNLTQAEWNQFIGPDIPYPAPALVSPDEGTSFPEGQDVKLVWEWERDLAENEFFEARIRPKGKQEFDRMDLTKMSYQFVPISELAQAGTYEWQVAIVLLSGEEKGASQIWSFEVR